MPQDSRHWIDVTTKADASASREIERAGVPGLTILCHPDPGRVGEQAALLGLSGRGECLSRVEPHFALPTGGEPRSLIDSHLSREPLRITAGADQALCLDPTGSPTQVTIGGNPVKRPLRIPLANLETGVVLLLAHRVALLLHMLQPLSRRPPAFGLIGESSAVLRLRRKIQRLADLNYPVLLRGESGTGKELVARALHEAGPRCDKPYVCVNLGGIDAGLANAQLFGTVKGAYPGAVDRAGDFKRADGGTLFLDEIGATPDEVQVKLLRALETQQVEPVGGKKTHQVDVRLISATDADLEAEMSGGQFRSPLFHRLSSCVLELPPLRQRRDDVGRLFFHFLRQELPEIHRLEPAAPDREPWVPAELLARLAACPWPGNVRQLRNVVLQLVVASRGEDQLCVPDTIQRLLSDGTQPTQPEPHLAPDAAAEEPAPPAYRRPEEISDTELVGALREARWSVQAAARALNVARPSLYKLIDKCPRVRKASELSREEIVATGERCAGNLADMAELLEVSGRGLRLRMTQLGLSKRRRW